MNISKDQDWKKHVVLFEKKHILSIHPDDYNTLYS